MANNNNHPLWAWQKDKDGFAPLLSQEEESDDDDAPLGTLELRPSQRHIQALAILKCHRLALDDTSLSILGGVFIRCQYFAREKHPAHGNSWYNWLAILGAIFYGVVMSAVTGLLSDHLDESFIDGPWNMLLALLYIPIMFIDWEYFHRKSKVYQSALHKFHDEVYIFVQEFNDLLQPHGFWLEANPEPDERTGYIDVQVRRTTATTTTAILQGALPPVSQEFLQRAKPLTEIDQWSVSYSILAMGVPIDEWTLGQLMMRYRCLQKEMQQDGRLTFWVKILSGVYLLLAMTVDFSVYYYFVLAAEDGDDTPTLLFLFWWLPFLVLMWPLCAGVAHLTEWAEGGPVRRNQRYLEATLLVSPLAVERHGMELVYKVDPGRCGTTKGVVQFVPVHDDQSSSTEDHGAPALQQQQQQLHVAVIV